MEKQPKYWLRGGLLFLLTLVVFVVHIYILFPISLILDGNTLFSALEWFAKLFGDTVYAGTLAYAVFAGVLAFLNGALWGWLYGKFKDRLFATHYLIRTAVIVGSPLLSTTATVTAESSTNRIGVFHDFAAFSLVLFLSSILFVMCFRSRTARFQANLSIALAFISMLLLGGLYLLAGLS